MAEQEKLRELDLSNKEDRKLLKRLIADKNKNRSYEQMQGSYRNIKNGAKKYNFTVMSDGTFRYNNEIDRINQDNKNLHDAISNSNRPQFSSPILGPKNIEPDINKYKVSVTYEQPKVKPTAEISTNRRSKQSAKSGIKPAASTKTDVKNEPFAKVNPTTDKSNKSDNPGYKPSAQSSSFVRPGWMSVMPQYSPQEYQNQVNDYLTTMHGSINQLQSSTGPRVNDSTKQGYPRVPGSTIASEYVEPIVPKTRDQVVRPKDNKSLKASSETVNTESTVTNQTRPMTSMGAVIPIGTYNAVIPSQQITLPYFSSNTGVYQYQTNSPTQQAQFDSAMSEALRKVGVDPRNPSSVTSLQQLLVSRGYLPKQQITGQMDDLTLQAFATYLAEMRSYKKGGILKAQQGTELKSQNTQTPTLDAIINNPQLAESFLQVLSQQLGKEISMEDLITASQNPELAPQLEAIAQQVMKQSAAQGAKLQYISRLRGKCPEGQELVYFAKGGKVCSACMGKKLEDGGKPKYMKDFEEKQKAKKGCKLKK